MRALAKAAVEHIRHLKFIRTTFAPSRKRTKAFGIVEVVIVLAIICVILGALIWIGQAAAANNVRSEQRAQATYLAQEGIEIVRQIRDSNWIDKDNATSWDSFQKSGALLIKPAGFFPTVNSVRFKTDFVANGFALSPLSGLCSDSSNFSDVSTVDKPTINNTEYRRTICLENYQLTTNGTDGIPAWGISNVSGAADFGTIYYIKVRSVVIWGPIFSTSSANKIEVSEILTNWRPNY